MVESCDELRADILSRMGEEVCVGREEDGLFLVGPKWDFEAVLLVFLMGEVVWVLSSACCESRLGDGWSVWMWVEWIVERGRCDSVGRGIGVLCGQP